MPSTIHDRTMAAADRELARLRSELEARRIENRLTLSVIRALRGGLDRAGNRAERLPGFLSGR